MKLALGTVQFGIAYGIAGRRSAVPEEQVRDILQYAWERQVRVLDTAAAYGDIEERLATLCGHREFEIVSKIGRVPAGLDGRASASWVVEQAERSRARLGQRLRALLLHRAEDLLDSRGERIWDALHRWGEASEVRVGVSAYDPTTVQDLRAGFGIGVAQLPGNAFDQRVAGDLEVAPGLEVHLRSAFLQGLLLMDPARAATKVPNSGAALEQWHEWCRVRGVSPLCGALAVVKSFSNVDCCVVGVDGLDHLKEITEAWLSAVATAAPELHRDDPQLIDPRMWSGR